MAGPGPAGPFLQVFAALQARAAELDVVHLHLLDPPALHRADALARAHPRLRVLVTLHLAALFPETTRAVRALLAAGTPVRFLAPSASAADSYDPRVLVVPNGVDLDRIQPAFAAPAEGDLAWVGRRSREKGLALAVALARRLGRRLHVAGPAAPEGSPPPVPEDRSTAEGFALIDHGVLPRPAVPALLAAAAVTLVTSTIPESQSLVAVESMAAGTPVVGFALGALPEVVAHGESGFLVPPFDLGAAEAAVRAAAALDRRRVRAGAERFGLERWLDAHERLYALA